MSDQPPRNTRCSDTRLCQSPAPVREELLAHLKGEQIEPPAWDRVRRIIGAALRQAEQALTARIASRIPAEAVATR
jgi:hypothetical protein